MFGGGVRLGVGTYWVKVPTNLPKRLRLGVSGAAMMEVEVKAVGVVMQFKGREGKARERLDQCFLMKGGYVV